MSRVRYDQATDSKFGLALVASRVKECLSPPFMVRCSSRDAVRHENVLHATSSPIGHPASDSMYKGAVGHPGRSDVGTASDDAITRL